MPSLLHSNRKQFISCRRYTIKEVGTQIISYLDLFSYKHLEILIRNNKTTIYIPISAYQSPAMELTDDTKCYIHMYYSILICNSKNIRSKNVVRGSTQNSFLNLVKVEITKYNKVFFKDDWIKLLNMCSIYFLNINYLGFMWYLMLTS